MYIYVHVCIYHVYNYNVECEKYLQSMSDFISMASLCLATILPCKQGHFTHLVNDDNNDS